MQRQVTKLKSLEGIILSEVKEILPSRKLSTYRNQKITISLSSPGRSLVSSSLQWRPSFNLLTKSYDGNISTRGLSTFNQHVRFMSSNSSDNSDNNSQSHDDSSSTTVNEKGKSKQEKEIKETTNKNKRPLEKNPAKAKLHSLLDSIVKDTEARKKQEASTPQKKDKPSRPAPDLAIPSKPVEMRRQKKVQETVEESLPGDVKLGKRVLSAVKKVAESLGGDVEQIESELVQKLKSERTAKTKLSDLVKGMQIDSATEKTQVPQPEQPYDSYDDPRSRTDRVRQAMQERPPRRSAAYGSGYGRREQEGGDLRHRPRQGRDRDRDRERYPRRDEDERGQRGDHEDSYRKFNLFGAPRLNIFDSQVKGKAQPESETKPPTTWEILQAKELKLRVTHPPANGFEEMIQWTEQKRLWSFPIDNELGMDEENQYSFADHVFLEPLIDPWCPPDGPIRTFMELVCISLGKNPYLTVPEKRDYLEWYYEYFKEKNPILAQIGSPLIKDIGEFSQICPPPSNQAPQIASA